MYIGTRGLQQHVHIIRCAHISWFQMLTCTHGSGQPYKHQTPPLALELVRVSTHMAPAKTLLRTSTNWLLLSLQLLGASCRQVVFSSVHLLEPVNTTAVWLSGIIAVIEQPIGLLPLKSLVSSATWNGGGSFTMEQQMEKLGRNTDWKAKVQQEWCGRCQCASLQKNEFNYATLFEVCDTPLCEVWDTPLYEMCDTPLCEV